MFHLTVLFPESYQVIRYYNERNHGKGPMDGIGDCVKDIVFRAVLSEKVVIHSPKDLARLLCYNFSVFYFILNLSILVCYVVDIKKRTF